LDCIGLQPDTIGVLTPVLRLSVILTVVSGVDSAGVSDMLAETGRT